MFRFNSFLKLFGFDLERFKNSFFGLFWYIKDFYQLKTQKNDALFPIGKLYPVLDEKNNSSGNAKGHYFHQDLLVARKIYHASPVKHIDIGSRVDGLISHLAVFRTVEVFDIRPLKQTVKNIYFKQLDLMSLPKKYINYCDSISSLHAIEHFGLGRYGDSIDYFGHVKAIENITLMLKSGGVFYFSAPIGKQRIEFNAHRVFSIRYLLGLFEKNYSVNSFSYVDDGGLLHENIAVGEGVENNFGCVWGCGIFELIKK